ncbi:MerR family transcriptional regulator [Synechococcus sp. BA-132 BA5]|uniref:MerR family transcriptional regulator n=1 Tax=Synechococcus sp. BA-132 BA5 TaxID=3110252 RepID=UPI002B20D74A|nr:MerR family transcriptional regulator [Synechococcus sp. BA-132 BA5]MEA5415771.1 MerR family transcriptional regulator [Synechococcus sp. BA-132 BA5]
MVKVSTPADALYGLEDLLVVAGDLLGEEISPRTVRLYATQGLIDRPGKDGRSAVYGHRHLLQLVLVRALARRGLSLSAIAPFCVLADADLEQQLEQLDGEGATATAPCVATGNEAMRYLRDLSDPADDVGAEADGSPSFARKPAAMGSVLGMLNKPLSSLSRSERTPSGSRSSDGGSRWLRLSLAPGIELHLRESVSLPPAGSRRQLWLQRLLDRLNALLIDASR